MGLFVDNDTICSCQSLSVANPDDILDDEPLEQPPVAVQPPVPAADRKPTTVAERLRAFKAMVKPLIEDANKRLDQLKRDCTELTAMLKDAEAEMSLIIAELHELGSPVAGTPSYAEPQKEAVTQHSLPLNVKAHDFLASNRGVWFHGRELLNRIGADPHLQPSQVLHQLWEAGKIERTGSSRATMYRMPALE